MGIAVLLVLDDAAADGGDRVMTSSARIDRRCVAGRGISKTTNEYVTT